MDSTPDPRYAAPLARTLLPTQPDHRLALLAREGHEQAFAEIVRRHRNGLVRYAAAIVPVADAEDVVQTALVKAHSAIDGIRGDLLVRPWLYRIVRNTALNFLRDHPAPNAKLSEELDGVPQPPELVERREQLAALLGAIDLLPASQRTAIVARELEGRSHREIATALAISPGAARQLIHRARITLRDGIGIWLPLPLLRAALGMPGAVQGSGADAGAPTQAAAGAGAGGGAGAGATSGAGGGAAAGGGAGAGGSAGGATGTGASGFSGAIGGAGGLKAAAAVTLAGAALAAGGLLPGTHDGRNLAAPGGPSQLILPLAAQQDAHPRGLADKDGRNRRSAEVPGVPVPGGTPQYVGTPESGPAHSDHPDKDADRELVDGGGGGDSSEGGPPADGEGEPAPPDQGGGDPAAPGDGAGVPPGPPGGDGPTI